MSPSSAGRLRRAAAGDGRNLGDQRVDFALRGLGVAARSLDQAGRHALLVVEQRLQQMRRRDPLMMFAHGDRLGRLQKATCAIGQFLKVHRITLLPGGDMVWPLDHTRARVSVAEVGCRALAGWTTVARTRPSGRRSAGSCADGRAGAVAEQPTRSATAAGRRWRYPPGRTIGGQLATFGSAPQRRYLVVSTWKRRKA